MEGGYLRELAIFPNRPFPSCFESHYESEVKLNKDDDEAQGFPC